MSPDNVKSFEKEAFRQKLAKLAGAADVSDTDFADAVYTAVTAFGLPEDEFRDTFGLTKGAVERWMQRSNLPQPIVRPKILLWMSQQLGPE